MSQEETELRKRMIKDAKKQGMWASNTNDKFTGGKPDMRVSHNRFGQLDIELKILRVEKSTWDRGSTVDSGITRLQRNEIRDMNAAGAPACGLILVKCVNLFIFCNDQMVDLLAAKHSEFNIPYRHRPLDVPCVNMMQVLARGRLFSGIKESWL